MRSDAQNLNSPSQLPCCNLFKLTGARSLLAPHLEQYPNKQLTLNGTFGEKVAATP